MLVYECLMIMLMLCKSSYARLTPEVLQCRAHVAEIASSRPAMPPHAQVACESRGGPNDPRASQAPETYGARPPQQ